MNRSLLLFIGLMACGRVVNAQEGQTTATFSRKGCSCGYSVINQIGFTEGSKNSAFLLQSINGIRYKTWFAGLGVGLDYYHVRGIPVFLDIRKNILKKTASPFVYADGGMQFTWERNANRRWNTEKRNSTTDCITTWALVIPHRSATTMPSCSVRGTVSNT